MCDVSVLKRGSSPLLNTHGNFHVFFQRSLCKPAVPLVVVDLAKTPSEDGEIIAGDVF